MVNLNDPRVLVGGDRTLVIGWNHRSISLKAFGCGIEQLRRFLKVISKKG